MPDDEVVVSTWDGAFARRWLANETTASSWATPSYGHVNVTWESATARTALYTSIWNSDQEIRYVASTQEQREAYERHRQREDERRRERERVLAQLAQAEDRARGLLLSLLDDDQRRAYEAEGHIETVVGSCGGRYRIGPGTNGNVHLLDDTGREIARLCAHPELALYDDAGRYLGELPWADVAAGQLLALTADERHFYGVANVQWWTPAAREHLCEMTGRAWVPTAADRIEF